MALKLTIAPKVKLRIQGGFKNEEGKLDPFDFSVTLRRQPSDALSGVMVQDFLAEALIDWEGVEDEQGNPLPFSAEEADRLLKTHGMAGLIFGAYVQEGGAIAKN